MPERGVGEILVNSRTITIADDVIAIGHITRVRVISYVNNRGVTGGVRAAINISVITFLGGLVLLGYYRVESPGAVLAVIGALSCMTALFYAYSGTTRWLLLVELSSGAVNVLASSDMHALWHLRGRIWAIIEDPPSTPGSIEVNNVFAPDARGVQIGGIGNTQQNRALL